ncbi:MAG: hypothetical protein HAW63_03685 [Bdellovibrionaceae bacterium]|nr:hypothetical protein [Pseudobdellovibrionaceae bacterium]
METEINNYLKTNSLNHCVDFFSQKLKTEAFSFKDSQTIVFFLQANNQRKSIYSWVLRKLKSHDNFSFSHLLWLLDNNIDEDLEDLIVQGILSTKSDCSTFSRKINSKKIQDLINKSLDKKKMDFKNFKEELIEKINYARLNNLKDVYEENIKELSLEFNDGKDTQVNVLIKEFEQQNLENILTKTVQKYKNRSKEKESNDLHLISFYKKYLMQTSVNLIKKNPQLSYDLSLLAQNLQMHQLSESILSDISEQTEGVIWLRAHNLIQSKNFLKALDLIDSNLHKANPKYLLDYNYLKALAWKGLDNTKKAIEILDEILLVKNNYRNAIILKELYLKELKR